MPGRFNIKRLGRREASIRSYQERELSGNQEESMTQGGGSYCWADHGQE